MQRSTLMVFMSSLLSLGAMTFASTAATQSPITEASTTASANAPSIATERQSEPQLLTKNKSAQPLTFSTDLESRAQQIAKKLPKDILLAIPNSPPRVAPQNPGGGIQVLEEIIIKGKFDPADYVAPRTAPMLVFRSTLDGQRPMTPKEIKDTALCFIGFCPLLNADGLPIANTTPEQRAAARLNTPFTPSFGQGTLQ